MDILIVLFLVFVAAPFALLMWMPGWKSVAVAAVLLLSLVTWFWISFAMMPARTGFGQAAGMAVVNVLRYAMAVSVLTGIGIKAVLLSRRKRDHGKRK